MHRRVPLRLILAALAAGAAAAAPAQPPPGPATIPAELRPYAPSNLAGYFVGFLIARRDASPVTGELFIRHQAYVRHQFEAGLYHLAGPLTDGGQVRGLVVVSAPTRDAARALIAADPLVEAGLFTVEMHTALFPDLSPVRAEYCDSQRPTFRVDLNSMRRSSLSNM